MASSGGSVQRLVERVRAGIDTEPVWHQQKQNRANDADAALAELTALVLAGEKAMEQLRDAWVRELYTEEGARIWIADAEKKGYDLLKQLERLEQLRTGAYA